MPPLPPRALSMILGLCTALLSLPPCAAPSATTPQPSNEALELDSLEVIAEGLGARTEGTGAYTTGPMSTATRLPLKNRDTPQAVSVVTRQQMDDFKLGTLSEAMQQTPGVVVQRNDSERVTYSARGYTISNYQYDGMLTSISGLQPDDDTIIYDRIEVVRGATGLTTGAGDPSGTLNLVRKRPGEEWQSKAGISAGSYDNYYSYLDAGGPLAFDGRLRGRSVLAYRDSKDFRDRYAQQREVAYGVLEADLADDTLFALGYDYQTKHVQGSSYGTVPFWNALGDEARLKRSTNMAAPWSAWPVKNRQLFVTLDQGLDHDWHLKAAYTHNRRDSDGKVYYGGSGYPAADGSGMNAWTSHFVGWSQMEVFDLNLAGPYTLFDRHHELMVGYGEARKFSREPYLVAAPLPPDYTRIPDWRHMGDIVKFSDTVTALPAYKDTTWQKAGYLATRLELTERFHAVLGSRYGSWETVSEEMDYDDLGRLASEMRTRQVQNDQWTPYAGLLYDFDEHFTGYVSYTDIFKPQTVKDAKRQYLDPIVGQNYELGLKGEFFESRLNFSGAAFWSKQDNVAEVDDSVPPDPLTGAQAYKSGGKGNKIRGFELELAGEWLPDWNLSGSYAYTHSLNGQGQRMRTNQPLDMARFSTTYRLPGDWHDLTVGGALNWQSDIYRNGKRPTGFDARGKQLTETKRIGQDAYTLVNLMARYDIDPTLSASLNVDNLFDKQYFSNVGFYNGVYWGDPRTFTLSLDWQL